MKQREKSMLLELMQKMKETQYGSISDEEVEKILEKFNEESFMEGYCYAIEVLKNGIVKKKTE